MGRICKNKITDHIRDHFRANPLRVPEARIKPMTVLEINKKKQQYLGEFKFLVKGGFTQSVPLNEETVAEVSDTVSKATDVSLGFEILGGFLKAMGTDPASVSASFSKSKKLAFSFTNVRRRFIDPLQLGSILSQDIFGDINNFMLHPAINEKHIRLALITDVLVSNNFTLSSLTEAETAVAVDIPMIEQAVANSSANVKVSKTADHQVMFEGPTDLTFAFTCLEINIDPTTGRFSRGDWMKNIKSLKGEARSFESLQPGEESQLDQILLDDNEQFPLLIDL